MIGAHVSVSGGLVKGLERGQDIGCEAIQIFTSAPQRWERKSYTTEELSTFKTKRVEYGIQLVVVHACYLINVASDNPETVEKSMTCIASDLAFCGPAGALGVVVHFGSHLTGWGGAKNSELVSLAKRLCANAPKDVQLIIEISAGGGGKMPKQLEEMARMRDQVDMPNLSFCLDTCHLWAGGYDISGPTQVEQFSQRVKSTLGWEAVSVIHVNDAKDALNSHRDRHQNLGDGSIGHAGLQAFVTLPEVREKPLILEVPGIEDTGPDVENIQRLKKYFS